MKNISRRTFIKGMAVAAAATAASTVLAGCNLPVGPVEPEVVPGFQPESKTFEFDDDKTFTLSTTGFATAKRSYNDTYNNLAVLSVTAVNGLDKSVWMPNNNGTATMGVTVYVDEKGQKINQRNMTTFVDNDLWNKEIVAANDTVTATTKGNLYFDLPEEWSMLTFVFTLDGEKVEFVVNK